MYSTAGVSGRFGNDLVRRPDLVEQGAHGGSWVQALPDSSQGMRARSCAPTFSIGCVRSAFSSLEYLRRPARGCRPTPP